MNNDPLVDIIDHILAELRTIKASLDRLGIEPPIEPGQDDPDA